jgi:hypothetical protein
MKTTEIVLVLAGLAVAVGAICYWRAEQPAEPGHPVGEQKDLLSAMRRKQPGSSAGASTGWGAG